MWRGAKYASNGQTIGDIMIVDEIIESYGGAAALAKRLHINRSTVCAWKKKQKVPVGYVLEIERLTDIPRYRIRPDIWQKGTGQ